MDFTVAGSTAADFTVVDFTVASMAATSGILAVAILLAATVDTGTAATAGMAMAIIVAGAAAITAGVGVRAFITAARITTMPMTTAISAMTTGIVATIPIATTDNSSDAGPERGRFRFDWTFGLRSRDERRCLTVCTLMFGKKVRRPHERDVKANWRGGHDDGNAEDQSDQETTGHRRLKKLHEAFQVLHPF